MQTPVWASRLYCVHRQMEMKAHVVSPTDANHWRLIIVAYHRRPTLAMLR